MARDRRVSDEDLARLRDLAADGWTHEALAVEFGVSRQHVGRLVRGEQRADLPPRAEPETRDGEVSEAVERYLDRVTLNRRDEALAAIARSLASKLDSATSSESATAAAAAPRLAAELASILETLEDSAPREPTGLDRLRVRYEALRAGVEPPAWALEVDPPPRRRMVDRSPPPPWVFEQDSPAHENGSCSAAEDVD